MVGGKRKRIKEQVGCKMGDEVNRKMLEGREKKRRHEVE